MQKQVKAPSLALREVEQVAGPALQMVEDVGASWVRQGP